MKTDMQLKDMVSNIIKLRVYDDDLSILIRLKIIEELNMQIKNMIISKMHKQMENKDTNSDKK